MRRDVSDEQAALIATAMGAQRHAIVSALDELGRSLGFRHAPAAAIRRDLPPPDVLRGRREGEQEQLFVAHARGFTEPVHDEHHREHVQWWMRRFARLVDARRGEKATLAGGYVIVGTYDEASAHAWATLLTKLARPHRLYRDGAPARFVARRLGSFWMAC